MSFRPIEMPIPDDPRLGVPDPRVLARWLVSAANPQPPLQTVDDFRRAWQRSDSVDLSSGITQTETTVAARSGPVRVLVFRPDVSGVLPAIVHIHGGGFIAGTPETAANVCRLLAHRARAVVFSVDYRLAPETPFPGGLEDCWDAVVALHGAAGSWGVDPRRFAVSGDSAGGNLAAACCVLDARSPARRLAAQLLIYPAVDMRTEAEGRVTWSAEAYDVRLHGDLVWPTIRYFVDGGEAFAQLYLNGHSGADPLVSPLAADPALFPPTLMLTAEFDGLRFAADAFAERLAGAGVPVRSVRYRGMEHGFFAEVGVFPQASALVDEMAAFLASVTATDADERLASQLAFLLEIDKLKLVVRRNELADASRRENTAEHSWHLVLFALTLAEHTSPGLDLGRVVRLCALHDLVEIDAGDTFFWDEKGYADKEARERAAARRLFGLLPTEQGQAYEALWEEFEACQSAEAVYANAVDRLAPVMLNTHSGGRSWRENGITAEKILSKMSVIAQASPRLGRALENLVKAAAEKGFLGTAP
jgi:acetyl esterase/lipase/5'-deoxynucleotidase YfbR-like HD superfamily hydrolase